VTVTRLALGLGVLLVAAVCWLAADGVGFAYELLISLAALVVLVGGGNWLGGRRSASAPEPGRPGPTEP
jgi:hypothetical protein